MNVFVRRNTPIGPATIEAHPGCVSSGPEGCGQGGHHADMLHHPTLAGPGSAGLASGPELLGGE